jgi:hypothetical protein
MDALKAHWRLYVLEGVTMIVLGVLAIAYPVFATLAVDLYLGWLFLLSGLFALMATFSARQFPGFWWALRHSAALDPCRCNADLEARGGRHFADRRLDSFFRRRGCLSSRRGAQLSRGSVVGTLAARNATLPSKQTCCGLISWRRSKMRIKRGLIRRARGAVSRPRFSLPGGAPEL